MKSILDRSFRYVPSASTDLRRTFARIRREQRAAASVPGDSRLKSADGTSAAGGRDPGPTVVKLRTRGQP